MRNLLSSLFSHSPFSLLQAHMNKVNDCIVEIPEIFKALEDNDNDKIDALSKKISKLEHIADITKQDIRKNLPKNIFLPISRETVLEFLSIQDSIADRAENIGVLLTLCHISFFSEEFKCSFYNFLNKNIETFKISLNIIDEMDLLLQSSFGGNEADKVQKMVENVAYCEHEADLIQRELLQIIFKNGEIIPYHIFTLWLKVIKEMSAISNLSEKLAYKVKNVLDIKS